MTLPKESTCREGARGGNAEAFFDEQALPPLGPPSPLSLTAAGSFRFPVAHRQVETHACPRMRRRLGAGRRTESQ